jgi:hypothetical protein
VQDMRVNGKMTYNMDRGKRHGPMVAFMKDYILLVKSMVRECTRGMMDQDMMASGLKTR